MPRRRRFLATSVGLVTGVWWPLRVARAQSAIDLALGSAPVREILRGASAERARVVVDTPHLADTGHAVPLRVAVDSPMTATDHVKSIVVVAEKNPRPLIARYHFGPHSGKAEIITRIRLAASQAVVVLAELSDGRWYSGAAEVVVTESACMEDS